MNECVLVDIVSTKFQRDDKNFVEHACVVLTNERNGKEKERRDSRKSTIIDFFVEVKIHSTFSFFCATRGLHEKLIVRLQ